MNTLKIEKNQNQIKLIEQNNFATVSSSSKIRIMQALEVGS